MKNKIIIISVLLLAAFAACKKEDSRTVTATLERYNSDSKAYIDSRYFACWSDGDMVSINGTPHAISINNDGTATIADVPTGELTAFYPAHRIEGNTVTFPFVQEYNKDYFSGRQLIDNPMAAYSDYGNELRFQNIGALIEVTLKPTTTIEVMAIEVKGNDNQKLWGEASLVVDDGIPHLTSLTNGGNSVVLHFNEPEVVTPEGKAFYIVVPANSVFDTLSISVLQLYYYERTYTSPSKSKYIGQSISRNHIGAITYNLDNDDSYQPSWMIKYTSTESFINLNQTNWEGATYLSNADGLMLFDNALTSIPDDAFYWCENLATISLPYTITSIGTSAFKSCTNLTSISLPNSLTSIGDNTFAECTNLTSISLPNSLTSIGSSAFAWCSSLTNISLPNNLTSIGNYTFYACQSLTSISLPNNITSIGNQAFYGCINLTTISLPNSITSIENQAFAWCSSLTNISLPNSLTSIGAEAFLYCESLSDITIPNNVTSIGDYAFSYCENLRAVYCKPYIPPTIDMYPFDPDIRPNIYVPNDAVNAYLQQWFLYINNIYGYSF